MGHVSKIKVRHIAVFSIVFLAAFAYFTFAKSAPPSLDEVLRKPDVSFNWGFAFFGVFALSLSTLSLAKAYELFKRPPKSVKKKVTRRKK